MFYRKWKIKEFPRRDVDGLKRELGIDTLPAKLLLSRGYVSREEAREKFFQPRILSDPFLLKDMDKAVDRINSALERGERIAVYGDYDVDGVCATALLYTCLENRGGDVFFKLPNRERDGYGLNSNVLKELYRRGASLVLTVDNGISAVDQIDYANSLGLDVIVTDHHLPGPVLPAAMAVVDPLRRDDESPCKTLAGVGVALKLASAVEGADCRELLDLFAEFVGVGTLADLMILEGENRTFVKTALEILNESPGQGFKALIKVCGLAGRKITSENLSYNVIPRLNSAGRMGDASDALELLLCDDPEEAEHMAASLEENNRNRKSVQNRIADEIMERISLDRDFDKDRVIVVRGDDYHPGVVGIVASHIVDKYSKPAIVLTKEGESGVYKGSGRSIPVFNLYNALSNTRQYLLGFGGHELAAGLTIKRENIEPFRRAINEFALKNEDMGRAEDLQVDCLVDLCEVTATSARQTEILAPFGNGNPTPVFAVRNVQITAVYQAGEGRHTKVKFRQGQHTSGGILFSTPPRSFAYKPGDMVDIAFNLSVYNGETGQYPSLKIIEVRPVAMTDRMVDEYSIYNLSLNGFALSRRQKAAIRPDRRQTAVIWRKIVREKVNAGDLMPLFAGYPDLGAGRIRSILTVLEDVGLVEKVTENGGVFYRPIKTQEKKDLMSSPFLQSLQ